MFSHLLRTAVRSLARQRRVTGINALGLAIALASCALILSYVAFERSYDSFHPEASTLVQLSYEEVDTQAMRHVPAVSPPVGPTMVRELPEVQAALRFRLSDQRLASVGDLRFYEDRLVYADSTLFTLTGFDLVRGDPRTALSDPGGIVLTESTARKYFGDADPMGRVMQLDDVHTYTVTGIMSDLPRNTHMRMQLVLPFDAFEVPRGYPVTLDDWQWISFPTYLKLAPGTDLEAFEASLVSFMQRHWSERSARAARLRVNPVPDVYLAGPVPGSFVQGNPDNLQALSLVALLILLLALFNHANLSAVQGNRRLREVGVRRMLGASGLRLMAVFLTESVLLALLAFGLAIAAVSGVSMFWDTAVVTPSVLVSPFALGVFLVLVLVGSMAPWTLYAGMSIQSALGGTGAMKAPRVRKALVVLQFAIAAGMMVVSLVVWSQLDYMMSADVGFDREHVVAVDMEGEMLTESFAAIRSELGASPRVLSVSAAGHLLDGDSGSVPMTHEGADPDDVRAMNLYGIDQDFVETLGLDIVQGRALDRSVPGDSTEGILLNRAAADYFAAATPGWSDPIGKSIVVDDIMSGRVVGVLEDFHYAPLDRPIEPLVMIVPRSAMRHVLVRVTPGNALEILADLETRWRAAVPHAPFAYRFLDDHLASLYSQQKLLQRMTLWFTILAVLVACLGLYAVSEAVCAMRAREIAIRRVLGASRSTLLGLLVRPFVVHTLIANAVALPVAWYAMARWLDGFAYRIEPGIVLFGTSAVLTVAIGLLAVAART